MVGNVGFHGQPGVNAASAADALEIGYGIHPEHRRQGYATEAVEALIGWARTQGIAHFVASVSRTTCPRSPSSVSWASCAPASTSTLRTASSTSSSSRTEMPTFRYVIADVFTDTPLEGNGVASSPTRGSSRRRRSSRSPAS